MKSKFFKLLNVVLALAMIFSTFACVISAAEATTQDVIADDVVSPALASGTVNGESGMSINKSVGSHSVRLYTVNNYKVADYESVIVGSNCRVYVQFWDADGLYTAGSGWKTAGTHILSEMSGFSGATYFKITFDSADGKTTPATSGLKLVQKTPAFTPSNGDTYANGVVSPSLASGTVNGQSGMSIDKAVASHAVRLYTVNNYEVSKYESITVGSNCRAYVQFWGADGLYTAGSGWKTAGTHLLSEMSGFSGAKYFKITFDSADGKTTPSVSNLKLNVKVGATQTPTGPETPATNTTVTPAMAQGTIDKGSVNSGVTTRIHTSDFIYLSDIQNVSIGSGYKVGYHFYDKNGTWLNGHIGGWQTTAKTGAELTAMVSGATYVKIVLGKTNDGSISASTLPNNALVITLANGLTSLTKPDTSASDPDVKINFSDYIYDRGNGLANTFAKLNKGETINVLYMGGSVTNGTGASERETTSWRGIISTWLKNNAGKGKVNNVNAAYGDTCTLFGSYRLNVEILPEEPDLIFIEFGINDMYNSRKRGYTLTDSASQFETIVRGIRKALPDCDIVTILTTEKGTLNPNSLQEYAQGHENIAIAYNIPSIHVGRALAKEIALTGNPWSNYSGDSAHPNDKGYAVYAGPIKKYLNSELTANGTKTTVTTHKVPTMVSDKLFDGDIKFIDADSDLIKSSESLGGSGFAYSSGASNLGNSGTDVFKGGVYSKSESDVLVVKFTGTELAMIEYQPITGFSVSVDNGKYVTINRDGVRPIVLATNLKYGEHTVRIKPIFSSQSSSLQIQGFFTRNQNAITVK